MPDPIVTVWRNKIPHECRLMYWGRKWKIHERHVRRIHLWTAHSPVIGGDTLVIDTRKSPGTHSFESPDPRRYPMPDVAEIALRCYHADGQPLTVRLSIETMHPRFALLDKAGGFSVIVTVNSGYE